MKIREWLKASSKEEQTTLIERVGTSLAYLRQLSTQHRQSSWRLAVKLEEESKKVTPGRVISKAMLLPDIAKAFKDDT